MSNYLMPGKIKQARPRRHNISVLREAKQHISEGVNEMTRQLGGAMKEMKSQRK